MATGDHMKDFFISYNKSDEAWAEWIAWTLEEKRSSVIIQVWDFRPGEDFVQRMDEALRNTKRTIAVVSQDYLDSAYATSEWHATFAKDPLGKERTLIPIKVAECNPEGLLRTRIRLNFVGLSQEQATTELLRILEDRPKPDKKPAFPRNFPSRKTFPSTSAEDYFSESWPVTDPFLVGRDKEIALLSQAWDGPERNIASLVGFGGIGKTALLNWWWIHCMRTANWRGGSRVFAWSFYDQGTGEGQQASADLFVDRALRWFGDPEMAESSHSPWEKGLCLANLVREQRTLLLLDGLEPLQELIDVPSGQAGCLNDSALRGLLCTLAIANPGLCVLTTRLPVEDLRGFAHTSVLSIDLEQLTVEAGVALLRHLGVKGIEPELRRAVEEFYGHALALSLLGRYLAVVHDGDILQRSRIPPLLTMPRYGGHATRVMQRYKDWLKDRPELDILHILSLFDRPAEQGAVQILRSGVPIKGLTNQIGDLSEAEWKYAISNLRDYRLLAKNRDGKPSGDQLDCHPLVRVYFGEQFRRGNPSAWREAHSRLYEYYKSLPQKKFPESLSELDLLYRAVAHGCQAQRFQEALTDVYKGRILRDENFSWKKYGNFGTELVALSRFFDHPWNNVVDCLNDRDKGFVLNAVGFHLMALARLQEAVHPMKAALEVFIRTEDSKNVALAGSNLCKLYLALGSLQEALKSADQCLELVAKFPDSYQRVGLEVAKAETLHQLGRLDEADATFCRAESMHQAVTPEPKYPLLYAYRGFRYCDLLIDKGEEREIQRRLEHTLQAIESEKIPFFALGISYLFIEQAYLFLFREGSAEAYTNAAEYIEKALDHLRRAGQQIHVARGLMARAELRRLGCAFVDAQHDLDEVTEIAARSHMRRFECDAHLEYCRLILSIHGAGDSLALGLGLTTAGDHLVRAQAMVEELGYHRRDPEVLLESARLNIYKGRGDLARLNLSKARDRADEIGCRRWNRDLQELEEQV